MGVAFSTGEEFDASWNRGTPLQFQLGAGQVIAGWDQGVQGMKVGGRRQLTIPAHLAYGDRGAGGGAIAPGETLIFVCDLVARLIRPSYSSRGPVPQGVGPRFCPDTPGAVRSTVGAGTYEKGRRWRLPRPSG